MECPFCGAEKTKVRWTDSFDDIVTRRRQCLQCCRYFSTRERIIRPREGFKKIPKGERNAKKV